MDTRPSEESGTITMLGMVTPGCRFRLEAVGCCERVGHTLRNDTASGATAVTLSATEPAEKGTPPRPATLTLVID